MKTGPTDDMYIGYQPNAPRRYKRSVRNAVLTIGAILLISAAVIGYYQREFNDGYFEFGQLTEVTGTLSKQPFPILTTKEGHSILLIGFGKAGALGTIEHMENVHGNSLVNATVTLRGTLIYGEGKILMELTEGEKALVEAATPVALRAMDYQMQESTLSGEVVDPKCYFGVMKPAEGKVHRSCAIRCVEGGIPPVLKVTSENQAVPQFYLLEGTGGRRINSEVSDYIGDQVLITGSHYTLNDDWQVLRIDPGELIRVK